MVILCLTVVRFEIFSLQQQISSHCYSYLWITIVQCTQHICLHSQVTCLSIFMSYSFFSHYVCYHTLQMVLINLVSIYCQCLPRSKSCHRLYLWSKYYMFYYPCSLSPHPSISLSPHMRKIHLPTSYYLSSIVLFICDFGISYKRNQI